MVELNDFIRHLHNKGLLDVLSFSEVTQFVLKEYLFMHFPCYLFLLIETYKQTQVTPIVEGYGGWALRMEIVPIESAYPGYGELVVSYILMLSVILINLVTLSNAYHYSIFLMLH